ncbi:hypothetical protein KBD71_05190 [Candidatus Woesebacteria bacterium]|nr:hypothetical protein [Candidatus Woesebacteria bacterium]
MPYKDVEWEKIAIGKTGKSLHDLNVRRKELQDRETFTSEEANRLLIGLVRAAMTDISTKPEWKNIDTIVMGQWLFTITSVSFYPEPVDIDVVQQTRTILRIIRF